MSTIETPGIDATMVGAGDGTFEWDASPDSPEPPQRRADSAQTNSSFDAGDAGSEPIVPVWHWGSSSLTENRSLAFVGYDQGCSDLGELNSVADGVLFRVGYQLTVPVASRLKHYGGYPGPESTDDGSLDGYQVKGTILLIWAAQETRIQPYGDFEIKFLTAPKRLVAAGPPSADRVSISGMLSLPGGNPCKPGDSDCRALLEPTFVVVWQNASGGRAYQFIRPEVVPEGYLDRPRFADCPTRPDGPGRPSIHQSLGVYWPLREDLAMELGGAPDPTHWTGWIDEVLPR